ncbi:MAG: response regulator [Rhodothermus sp.]|nr:response regulator [Rhodothermus sp.]
MGRTIFIVDDSTVMRSSLKANLEMQGFQVAMAADGEEALAQLKNGLKPDLILTDINMPKMDGLTLIREVRKLPGFRFVPILVLTTESQQAKREEARRLGATGWLVKPVSGVDLVNTIRKVLPGS